MIEIRLPYHDVLTVQSSPPPEYPYGVMAIGAPGMWTRGKTGNGVNVAVVDTGIAPHPDLKIAGEVDFTGEGPLDLHGHGTHVAGTIAANGRIKGVAPDCNLFNVKALNRHGGGTYEGILQAMRWCIENGMDVVNMSLGSSLPPDTRWHDLIKEGYRKGIKWVVAAGNWGEFGSGTIMYPAAYDECISVAAADIDRKHPFWSSMGKEAELTAAGAEVWSTHLNGTYAKLSGTSMACPHIAGAMALLIQKARLYGLPETPDMLRYLMHMMARDINAPGWDEKSGYGWFSFGPNYHLKYKAGEQNYEKNGEAVKGETSPVILNDRMMLSIRDLVNGMKEADVGIDYDHWTKTATAKNY